jgi:uncharacterized protein YdhG (YjbR/CyaY superfamily)
MTTRKTGSPRASSRKPASIDTYLDSLDDERRATLSKLQRIIRAAVPGAEECISYGMPAFRVEGRVVAGFQATSGGCSYYPFSGSTLGAVGDALKGFERTKSALHFPAGRPLPAALVRRLLRVRIAELPGARPRRPRSTKRSR